MVAAVDPFRQLLDLPESRPAILSLSGSPRYGGMVSGLPVKMTIPSRDLPRIYSCTGL